MDRTADRVFVTFPLQRRSHFCLIQDICCIEDLKLPMYQMRGSIGCIFLLMKRRWSRGLKSRQGIRISGVAEDKKQKMIQIRSIDHEKVQTAKDMNAFNVWSEIRITVVWGSLCVAPDKRPREDSIIMFDVHMDALKAIFQHGSGNSVSRTVRGQRRKGYIGRGVGYG